MFTTHLQALDLGIEPNGLGFQLWDTVEMLGQSSWFFVNIAIGSGANICPKSAFFASWRNLDELLKAQNEELSVTNVMLVSSPVLNGTKHWRMERLVSLYLALEQAGGELRCVYDVADTTYVEPSTVAALVGEFLIYRESES